MGGQQLFLQCDGLVSLINHGEQLRLDGLLCYHELVLSLQDCVGLGVAYVAKSNVVKITGFSGAVY